MAAMKIIGGSTNQNAKKIGWLHNVNLENDVKNFGGEKPTKKVYKDIETLICVSKQAKEKVKLFCERNAEVFAVNNPNDTARIRALANEQIEVKKESFTFVVVARVDEYQKAFFRLLRVCRRLNEEGLDYSLWIVGDGIDYERVVERAKELKLSNVKFFGKQANPYPYIKNADMYLCASNFEGFSMVMMEAVILGTPMLSTAVSGADEMLDNGKYGIIVENSEEGLYNGMKTVLTEPDTYLHVKEMAQLRKDYLSEDKIMDRVETIIEGRTIND